MDNQIMIRPYKASDTALVSALFINVNRLLAPPHMVAAFEDYITRSLEEEINRITDYYSEKGGSFWIAENEHQMVGMFGLEASGVGDGNTQNNMELRRMYVNPEFRRQGIAQKMLNHAENHCRSINVHQLDLSTSEIQSEALAFYRAADYTLTHEETAETASNKTIGGGIKRYHFMKML